MGKTERNLNDSGEWAKIDYYTGPLTPAARRLIAGLASLVVLAVALMLAMKNYGRS